MRREMDLIQDVLVCDDHPLFRKGVVSSLQENPCLKVVAEASNGDACIAKLQIFEPNILITDLSMPGLNGFEILQWTRINLPETIVFILSMHTDLQYLQKAVELGAAGFLSKEDAQFELLGAIDQTGKGFYTSQSIGTTSPDNLLQLQYSEFASALRNVSDAEMRVLVLLTKSLTSREIADQLSISPRTVETHRANLAEKLDAKGPNKLLQLAIKHERIITGI